MWAASFRKTPPFDRILFLLSKWTPPLNRVLVIESGSRKAAEEFIARLYREEKPERVDVLTCYSSAPASFDFTRGRVFYTHESKGGAARNRLLEEFASSGYSAVSVLCTGDDIMTKWKWVAALRVPAKVLIVNENADSFWLDRGHYRDLGHMADERLGLSRLELLRFVYQIVAFPFTLLILIAFAARVHTRRLLRKRPRLRAW
jgi:hypothetical protein